MHLRCVELEYLHWDNYTEGHGKKVIEGLSRWCDMFGMGGNHHCIVYSWCILYMMPTPIYCNPFSLSILHPTSHPLPYMLPYERQTAAKLKRIFIPSHDFPKPHSTHAIQSTNHANGLPSEQHHQASL